MREGHSVATSTATGVSAPGFAGDVQYYLSLEPRQLPSRYLYDPLGSALFEAICLLPWYRITRTESRLLELRAREIFELAGLPARIVELGSGSGHKLATLIGNGCRAGRLDLHLIDVSASALAVAGRTLTAIDNVGVTAHEASYEEGLRRVSVGARAGRTLTLFLGSNIGNFDAPGVEALLCHIRAALTEGDSLLIGADLVKPPGDLLLAYDDPLGVTAAFNRNLLCRINRELNGNFEIERFAHRAVWNAAESRVEMHLVSLVRQRVSVAAANVDVVLDEGETIWTESSYKFQPDEIMTRLADAGFASLRQWIDDGFALTLARAVRPAL